MFKIPTIARASVFVLPLGKRPVVIGNENVSQGVRILVERTRSHSFAGPLLLAGWGVFPSLTTRFGPN